MPAPITASVILMSASGLFHSHRFPIIASTRQKFKEELCSHFSTRLLTCKLKFNNHGHKLKIFILNLHFSSVLHHEPNFFRDAYLLITVKDRGFLKNDLFLGEALLPMSEIPVTDDNANLMDLPQIQLPLTKPSNYGLIDLFF